MVVTLLRRLSRVGVSGCSAGREGGKSMDPTKDEAPAIQSPSKRAPPAPAAVTPSPAKKSRTSSNNLSFQEASPSPRTRRKSLRRSIGKKRRRTLPPIYHQAAGLSDAISLSLPESDRLTELLHACFQYSVRKLENSLSHVKGFNAKSFSAYASIVKEKMNRFIERLSRDGTLKRCIEGSYGLPSNEEMEPVQENLRRQISVLTGECKQWDELLEEHSKRAEETLRHLEESRFSGEPLENSAHVPKPRNEVLETKPDYSAILRQQGAVFDNMEAVLDELQQSVQYIDSVSIASSSQLQQMSTQLKSRSFKPMEDSPVRTFLKVFQR